MARAPCGVGRVGGPHTARLSTILLSRPLSATQGQSGGAKFRAASSRADLKLLLPLPLARGLLQRGLELRSKSCILGGAARRPGVLLQAVRRGRRPRRRRRRWALDNHAARARRASARLQNCGSLDVPEPRRRRSHARLQFFHVPLQLVAGVACGLRLCPGHLELCARRLRLRAQPGRRGVREPLETLQLVMRLLQRRTQRGNLRVLRGDYRRRCTVRSRSCCWVLRRFRRQLQTMQFCGCDLQSPLCWAQVESGGTGAQPRPEATAEMTEQKRAMARAGGCSEGAKGAQQEQF